MPEAALREPAGAADARLPWRLIVLGTTVAGILSGLRIFFTSNALGAQVSFADGIASGLMDWWLWILFVPLAFALAARFDPSHAGPLRVLALHIVMGGAVSFSQLTLYSALSGLVRAVRYGYAFRVDLASPLTIMLAPGFITYVAVVALAWVRSSRLQDDAAGPSRAPVLAFRSGTEQVLLSADEIEWVGAAGNYLELHTPSQVHLVRETMKSVEDRLGGCDFLRIHRSTIVRRAAVVRVPTAGDQVSVVLRDGTRLPVGRKYREDLATLVP